MNFLNPIAFAWAVLIPLIVLFYFLKLKRMELPISSTFLWKKSIEDIRVNAPFQRLRKNFLLFLQILILALAILGLAQPFLDIRGFEMQSEIVLIDRSASMNARLGSGSRLDEAKRSALELVDDLSAGDDMAVIAFSSSARVVSPFSRSKTALRQAIRKITPGQERTDISEALEVASSLARLRQNPEVILISDGRFPEGEEIGLERAEMHYVRVGESVPNLAVTALDLRRGLDVAGEVEAFVRVENFSEESRIATLILTVEGKERDAREVEIPSGGVSSRVFGGFGGLDGVLEARIEYEGEDALQTDDRAYAILEQPEPMRVILATRENYFLEKLLALDPEVVLGRVGTTDLDPEGRFSFPDGEPADVVILDRVVPERLAPGGYLIIGAAPPIEGFERKGEVENPVVLDWDSAHPATRFVNLEALQVRKAGRIDHPRGSEVLVESDSVPLILAYESEGVRLVHVNFDIYDTNWPLRLSFPIFISNSIRWLAGREGQDLGRQVLTGGLIPITPSAKEGVVEIESPSGERSEIDVRGEAAKLFGRTDEVGIYSATYPDGRQEKFAINLLDAAESNLAPAQSVTLSQREVEASVGTIRTNREIWRPLVIAAFLILLFEWYIYNRRVHI